MTIVFLDPDGTGAASSWIYVIIRANTGVSYQHECGGDANEIRSCTGYLVPLMGSKFQVENGYITPSELSKIFGEHPKTSECSQFIQSLRESVDQLAYWGINPKGESYRTRLKLDNDRLNEIVEGWVPVDTPDGSGVLVWCKTK